MVVTLKVEPIEIPDKNTVWINLTTFQIHIYAINLPFQTAENQLMNYARLVYLIWHFFQIRPYFYPTIDVSACTEVSRRIAFSVYGDDHIGVAFLKVFFTILCEARLKDKLAYLFKDFANSKYWIRHIKYALMLMWGKMQKLLHFVQYVFIRCPFPNSTYCLHFASNARRPKIDFVFLCLV